MLIQIKSDQGRGKRRENEGSRSPSGNRGMCRGLCLATTDPPHSCGVEARAELMTVRLAELVNARMSEE